VRNRRIVEGAVTLTTDRGIIRAHVGVLVNQWSEIQYVSRVALIENTSGWDAESAKAGIACAIEDGRCKVDGVA